MTPFAIAGTVVGAAVALAGVMMFRRTTSFLTDSARVTGRITDFTKDDSTVDSSTGFYPTISFTSADGAEHQIVGAGEAVPPKIGEKVKVAYDPNNPNKAWVAGTGTVWLLPFAITIAGIGIVFYSVLSRG